MFSLYPMSGPHGLWRVKKMGNHHKCWMSPLTRCPDSSWSCSAITPGNDFCGTISPELAATPDSRGSRFDPEPATLNSARGYDLVSCNGVPALVAVVVV